jgi:hypothetical protein
MEADAAGALLVQGRERRLIRARVGDDDAAAGRAQGGRALERAAVVEAVGDGLDDDRALEPELPLQASVVGKPGARRRRGRGRKGPGGP